MNRYLLYLVLVNMLTNIIVFVPKILISYQNEGAVSAVLFAIPIGLTLCIVFTKALSVFPEKGLPEIFQLFLNKKIKNMFLVVFSGIWYSAGLLTLLGFTDIVNRYINPDLPKIYLAMLFAVVISFISQLSSERVMYLMELIIAINVPIVLFIVLKAFTSDYFSWDSVLEVGTHLFVRPSFKALAAATYTFSGYLNAIIINRLFKGKVKGVNFFIILLLTIFNLFTTFLIPFGFHGADGARDYLYPWISTADCLRVPYGPSERVIFLFLMLYISITIISAAIHWHVAFELLKGTTSVNLNRKKVLWILGIFCTIAFLGELKFEAILIIKFAMYWLMIRFAFEIALVFGLFFLSRRQKT